MVEFTWGIWVVATAHNGYAVDTFKEVYSGKKSDRTALQAARLRCRQSRASLLVAKLDRLFRNVAFLMNLRDAGVKFQALGIPKANPVMLTVMIGMAQHERELISARIKAALAARVAGASARHRPDVPPEFTRERLAIAVAGGIRSARIIEVLTLVSVHRAPRYLRLDNRPEFEARAILRWLQTAAIETAFIDPGKPWQNGADESFIGKFCDRHLSLQRSEPSKSRSASKRCVATTAMSDRIRVSAI